MDIGSGLLVFGFGGHARSIADVALAMGYKTLLFVDENAKPGEQFHGFSTQRTLPNELPTGWKCFPGAADNSRRRIQTEQLEALNWPLAILIAPTASIGIGAAIANGSLIAHHVHLGTDSRVGKAGIINTGAMVEHESVVGDYVHVSVNAAVAGRCVIGDNCFLGAGSTVIDKIKIWPDVIVGAGACVVDSIEVSGTYVGVPARRAQHQ